MRPLLAFAPPRAHPATRRAIRLRPAALVLACVAALAGVPTPTPAQTCAFVPPPKASPKAKPPLWGATFLVGAGSVKGLDSTYHDVGYTELGGTLHRVLPTRGMLGPTAGGVGTVEVARGFIDNQGRPGGDFDHPYLRVALRATALQPVTAVKGLTLCGAAALSYTAHSFPGLPQAVAQIPVTLGGSYAYPWGGVVFVPAGQLQLGYRQVAQWVRDSIGGSVPVIETDVNTGADWSALAGLAVRFGRTSLAFAYRFHDGAVTGSNRLEVGIHGWF